MSAIPYEDIENPDRYQCFVVFEPSSVRINVADEHLEGEAVYDLYNDFMTQLVMKEQTIKEKILHNRLSKVGHMLELLQDYDGVILTKFFDRIWRRYAYVSHLGESMFDLKTFVEYFPEYKADVSSLIATRYDESEDEFGDGVDDGVDDDAVDDVSDEID